MTVGAKGEQMEVLLLGVVLVLVISLADDLRGAWAAVRSSRRSLATALAFTFIIAQMAYFFVVFPFDRSAGVVEESIETPLIVLFFAVGILGAIGLVADRRRRRRAQADTEGGDDPGEKG